MDGGPHRHAQPEPQAARHGERDARGPAFGGTPQMECQSCRFPMLLTFVERDGEDRWVDCPYCGRHDEWSVVGRR